MKNLFLQLKLWISKPIKWKSIQMYGKPRFVLCRNSSGRTSDANRDISVVWFVTPTIDCELWIADIINFLTPVYTILYLNENLILNPAAKKSVRNNYISNKIKNLVAQTNKDEKICTIKFFSFSSFHRECNLFNLVFRFNEPWI